MAKKRNIIFSNLNVNENDWKEGYNEYCEMNDLTPEDCSFSDYLAEELNQWFEDETYNLNKPCGKIIAIADLGLWNGRVSGYQISKTNNLNAVLNMLTEGFAEVYVEGNDVKAEIRHHDGVNYITFREIREDRDIDNLCSKIYNQENVSTQMVSAYTRPLGKMVKEIYGWS